MTAGAELVCELAGEGIAVDVAEGRLLVRPSSALRPEHRAALREHLVDVLDALAGPDAWRILAKASNTHHFRCHACQAAGRGTHYGVRCAVGQLLINSCDSAFDVAYLPDFAAAAQRLARGGLSAPELAQSTTETEP